MKEELKKQILQIETTEELRETYDLLKRMSTHLKGIAMVQFKVGDKVSFIFSKRGIEIVGKITKINPTTIKLDCGPQGQWRVSPTCLKKV